MRPTQKLDKRKESKMKNRTIQQLLVNNTPRMAMNLQHFASGGSSDSGDNNHDDDLDDDADDDSDENDDNSGDDSDDSKDEKDSKKFTQDDMNKRATIEKKQGRRSAFKEMGFKSEKDAKEQMAEFRKWKESQMTPEQKMQSQIDDANNDKSEAEKRAEAAENKLAALEAGVKKDAVDDAVAIAMLKVTDDKSLDDVLNEMKTQPKYKGFFDGSDDDDDSDDDKGGTGSSLKHKRGSKEDSIGKRLGQQASKSVVTKSNFFKN